MISSVVRSLSRRGSVSCVARFGVSTRMFANVNIPTDQGQQVLPDTLHQTGKRLLELQGVTGNTQALVPDSKAGTKENPIIIPSTKTMRTVGFEDPVAHQILWFNLEYGHTHYVPEINLYFKLDKNDDN